MSISNYSDLVTAVARASFRSDLSSDIPNFIQLCESRMQIRLKLVDFESTGTLTVTSGSASLPADYKGMRNVYWDGDFDRALQYITPDRYSSLVLTADLPNFYTIIGTSIKFVTTLDGTAYTNYKAKFTPLSVSNATNAIITNYPDAYMHGVMEQLYIFTRDTANAAVRQAAFESALSNIIKDNNERKYGAALQVRVA